MSLSTVLDTTTMMSSSLSCILDFVNINSLGQALLFGTDRWKRLEQIYKGE